MNYLKARQARRCKSGEFFPIKGLQIELVKVFRKIDLRKSNGRGLDLRESHGNK